MPEAVARAILSLAGWYLVLGGIFAMAFHARGLTRVDPAADGASLVVRLLLTPGIVALWPVLLARWAQGASVPPANPRSPRRLRAAHRVVVHVLAALVPLVLGAAIAARPDPPPPQPALLRR